MELSNNKRMEEYVEKSMRTAKRLMAEMQKGTRLYSSKTKEGLLNYQFIVKHDNGKVEQYSKFGEMNTNQQTVSTKISSPVKPPIADGNLSPLTQPNDTYESDAKEKGEESSEEEEEVVEEMEEVEGERMSYTVFNEDKNELFYKNLRFKVDSEKDFFDAVEKTKEDEKKTDGWKKNGRCIHCDDVQCHIFKYGKYAINMANATRQGNSYNDRKKLLNAFYDAYNNASSYMKYINSGHPTCQITEDDLEYLPHCCYTLMDNWLGNIRHIRIAELNKKKECKSNKRQRTK